jgi:hypothetical protein
MGTMTRLMRQPYTGVASRPELRQHAVYVAANKNMV